MNFTPYIKQGWRLLPIRRGAKTPLVGGKEFCEASSDPEQLKAWVKKFGGCDWALALSISGLVAVDVDTKGMDYWKELITEHGEPKTLTQQSGSGVGRHYVFNAQENTKYRGILANGIDVKHHGFIVIEPTPGYKWRNKERPQDVPEWLNELIINHSKTQVFEEWELVPSTTVSESLRHAIKTIQNSKLEYPDWIKAGHALHKEFNGSQEGLSLWIDVSRNKSYKVGDDVVCAQKWAGFNPQGSTGIGSLHHIARAKAAENDFENDKNGILDNKNDEYINSRGKRVLDGLGAGVNWMNTRGYALVGGKVIKLKINKGIKTYKWVDNCAFYNETSDTCVKVENKKGDLTEVPIAKAWLESTRKMSFSEIVFRPPHKAPETALNLWTGIPCTPVEGDISPILELIHEVVCLKDHNRAEYLLDWFAHIVQRPDEKCTIVPTLVGPEQGTGKGLLTDGVMGSILKHTYYRVSSGQVLQSRFNVEQARRFLTVIDEALWKGDHEQANFLKAIIGAETLRVEEKFGSAYDIENYSRYMITTNSYEATKIEQTNRRYLIFSLGKKKDINFYSKLWDLVREETICQAFYGFLLNRDIRHFNSTRFPEELDNQGEQTKRRSMSMTGQFWCEVLLDEPRQMWVDKGLYAEYAWREFEEFSTTVSIRYRTTKQIFWHETGQLCGLPPIKRTHRGSGHYPITPTAMRERLCKAARLPYPEYVIDDSEYMFNLSYEDF